ncbi:excinuclease ABC subunit C [Candidatus Roizmanbacteria bacterium RIFCSPHIGHO2_02_FULL_37_13b]|uniref:Excinuclease ABC subunit C n=1 Tax=Candidatus Roizmanbacteria bacterium RIFCSPLOWO2_02_FULL_36_11 TaxID=1802071 RepID=A0A1F7JG48_9BACT|nr:MAG: excinuclease ABC subunit C [Candidatus Roizmanbacteria bacterium RIFCSPHIGHO2_02_FULL_37_13b]OGK54583.1 MAG: excinuclease ABC subunit C [Candidatus Roizmanbacteria bacterium RIFCSPLOWO2_02_FULL_36_11]
MYYTYVLESLKDKSLYKGYTDNLKRRLQEHNHREVDSTKYKIPWKVIYYEAYLNQQDATSREKFFKTQWGRNYLRRILKNYFLKAEHP